MPPRILPGKALLPSALVPSSFAETAHRQQPCKAAFSTSASRSRVSKPRQQFREWLNDTGRRWKVAHKPGPNYLARDRPFPMNPLFKSEPVLSDAARELIWTKIMQEGETVKAVSAELGVSLPRVAAVVRLKEVEKDWKAKGKPLAKPYAKSVLSMLPQKFYQPHVQNEPFEPINELHLHSHTRNQLFWPTSESRHFTRADAAAAFHPKMLPTDKRIPHPELVQMERDVANGMSLWEAKAKFNQATEKSERATAERRAELADKEEKLTTRVKTQRYEFRFKAYDAEKSVGNKGRNPGGVGWRYGLPYEDRKKGQVKIPTSVP